MCVCVAVVGWWYEGGQGEEGGVEWVFARARAAYGARRGPALAVGRFENVFAV